MKTSASTTRALLAVGHLSKQWLALFFPAILLFGIAAWYGCEDGVYYIEGERGQNPSTVIEDAAVDSIPDTIPDALSDVIPDTSPDTPAETVYDVLPEVLPDAPVEEDKADAGPGPDGSIEDPFSDMCGDLRPVLPVYYGTTNPSYVPLSPGQVWAVGTWGGCSGTLIAPTWVLTAEHCGLRTGADFCMGENPRDPNVCINTVRVIDNPASDMTLAELAEDATLRLPGVQPVPVLTEPMSSSWIGAMAEAAGYGQQEDGGYGEREFTAEPIVELYSHTLTIDGEGRHGVCFGDSGGPVFVIASDGSVRTAGDLSNGDGSCTGRDNYTRVDTSIDWIESYTGPTAVEGASCGSVDVAGRCNGNMAAWCGADDMLQTEVCADKCGWDAAAGGFRCITGVDPCGGYDNFGLCAGNLARWCEDGVPKARDCGACAQVCDEIDGMGAYCLDDPCGGLDYLGRCVGDTAEWCDEGELKSENCASHGQRCGYINDEIGYYCY